jgi:hypothetical protein
MRRACPTTKTVEGILHRGRASHGKHPFHSTLLASRRYRLVRWLKLSHVEQVLRVRRTCKEVDRAFHSRRTDHCGGTICCRVTSDPSDCRSHLDFASHAGACDLFAHAQRAPTRQAQVTPQERGSGLTWLRFWPAAPWGHVLIVTARVFRQKQAVFDS